MKVSEDWLAGVINAVSLPFTQNSGFSRFTLRSNLSGLLTSTFPLFPYEICAGKPIEDSKRPSPWRAEAQSWSLFYFTENRKISLKSPLIERILIKVCETFVSPCLRLITFWRKSMTCEEDMSQSFRGPVNMIRFQLTCLFDNLTDFESNFLVDLSLWFWW